MLASRNQLINIFGGAIVLSIIFLGMIGYAHAGWKDFVNDVKSKLDSSGSKGVSSSEVAEGLKEALRVGTKKSINVLGKKDGFFKDQSVKIPMPEKLKQVDKLLRNTGQKKLADQFIETMNRAAEKSVTATIDIFVDAIKRMTLKDAVDIYKGREDEATRYFRKTSGADIQKTIHPIVSDATQKTGVTSNYKKIAGKVRKLHPSLASSMPNIDDYVTEKTMDGIFHKIAKEEALIRKDPAARTTDILKKVFSQ